MGFVFQFYNLIPNLTAKENVELAAQIVPDAMNPDEALREVDLSDREQNFPAQLSGFIASGTICAASSTFSFAVRLGIKL